MIDEGSSNTDKEGLNELCDSLGTVCAIQQKGYSSCIQPSTFVFFTPGILHQGWHHKADAQERDAIPQGH